MVGTSPLPMIMFDPSNSWADPSFTTSEILTLVMKHLTHNSRNHQPDMRDTHWETAWRSANDQASAAINRIPDTEPLLQAAVAADLGRHLPPDHLLYVSNSMPVEYRKFYESHSSSLRVIGNRGSKRYRRSDLQRCRCSSKRSANHPLNWGSGLSTRHWRANARSLDITLTVVVLDDQGGGIFSHLPIARVTEQAVFDQLFTTRSIYLSLRSLTHWASDIKKSPMPLHSRAIGEPQGIQVLRIPIDSALDVDQHRRIARAVTDSIELL